jgi:hypothetical protein
VHEEEINVAGVVNEESLVAGGHHVACFLVGSETNLIYHQLLSWLCLTVLMSPEFHLPWYPSEAIISLGCFVSRTDGMTIWPLNRRRTRLSIPFGFLHDASRHL